MTQIWSCNYLHAFEAQLQSCPSFEFDPVVVCTEPGFILRLVARTDSAKNLERNRDKAMAKSKENMDGMKYKNELLRIFALLDIEDLRPSKRIQLTKKLHYIHVASRCVASCSN